MKITWKDKNLTWQRITNQIKTEPIKWLKINIIISVSINIYMFYVHVSFQESKGQLSYLQNIIHTRSKIMTVWWRDDLHSLTSDGTSNHNNCMDWCNGDLNMQWLFRLPVVHVTSKMRTVRSDIVNAQWQCSVPETRYLCQIKRECGVVSTMYWHVKSMTELSDFLWSDDQSVCC